MPTAPITLTDAPAAPDRSDRATFSARAIALDEFTKNTQIPQLRLALANVFANATDAFNDAADADTSRIAAALSETNAAASAIAAASSAGAPFWISGTVYALYAKVQSPINARIYYRTVAGGGVTDPSLDAVNWLPLAPEIPPQLLFSIGLI